MFYSRFPPRPRKRADLDDRVPPVLREVGQGSCLNFGLAWLRLQVVLCVTVGCSGSDSLSEPLSPRVHASSATNWLRANCEFGSAAGCGSQPEIGQTITQLS